MCARIQIYEKLTQTGLARNYFHTATGSGNTNAELNTAVNSVVTYDINKVNISGLSNYYDKTDIVANLTDVVYDYAIPNAYNIFDRAVVWRSS